MQFFLVFWGRHWGTGTRPDSVGTGMRASGISPGDEIFVMLSGSQAGRSLIGHGYATGSIFESPHPRNPAKLSNWVNVTWETWLDDEHGMPLTDAAEAAPNFYWRNPQGGGIRIEEGESLREAWQQHLDSLSETAFIAQPDRPSATIERTQTHNTLPAPTVQVDFHEVVSGPDLWGGGTFQADRHYLDVSSVHQDEHETVFVRPSGEIAYRWPTSKIQSIKWLGSGGGSHQREPAPPSRPRSPQATTAKTLPQLEGEPAPNEDETFTPEMIAKRREILEQAGSGTPNWDGARYRSLMDEAGIPHSDSQPKPHTPLPDASSPTTGTSSTTSRPPTRAGESWSEDDLLVEQVGAGANLDDIVRKHERSEGAIRSRLEKLNLVTHDSEIVHLFDEGWTIDELAGTFGAESSELYERFIRSEITPKKPTEDASTPDDANDRSPSTFSLTDEQRTLREKFLKMAGGGASSPNWDAELYRSLMDQAGIPRATRPPEDQQPSQGQPSTKETPSETTSTARRASANWTEREDAALIKSAAAGMSLEEVAQVHQRSENAIRVRYKKLGILAPDATIVRLFNAGWTIEELANHCREEPRAIRAQFIRSGINPERSAPTGVRRSDSNEASRPVINEMQSRPASKQPKKKRRQTTRRSRAEKPMENTDPYLSASGSGMVRNWRNRKARPAVTSDERAICKACDRPAMNCVC